MKMFHFPLALDTDRAAAGSKPVTKHEPASLSGIQLPLIIAIDILFPVALAVGRAAAGSKLTMKHEPASLAGIHSAAVNDHSRHFVSNGTGCWSCKCRCKARDEV